jgi:RNA polymerase sigma-70 factor (ECF subfamily)
MTCTAQSRRVSDSPEPDDARLVERLRNGDQAAYDVLVRRYLPRATAMARRLLGDPDDAADLVQDAFLRALLHIESCDERRGFGPWFFRLLINTGLNARRARSRRATEPEDERAASTEPSPADTTERNEIRERFRAALENLPWRQRLVVAMFEVDGRSTAEIADALGITPETVRWHHHQARLRLRDALADLRGRAS